MTIVLICLYLLGILALGWMFRDTPHPASMALSILTWPVALLVVIVIVAFDHGWDAT